MRHFLENLDPFKGMSVTEISNYVYEESKRIEPKNCRQPLKFPRKWPDIPLKSPGIKPSSRRNNSSASSMTLSGTLPFSKTSLLNNNDTGGEQSPPANSSSSSVHEYSIFAPVNIHSSSTSVSSQQYQHHNHHQQQQHQFYQQHHSTQGYNSCRKVTSSATSPPSQGFSQSVVNLASTADQQMAPEIPRRSDSIMLSSSLSSNVQYNLNNSSLSESSGNPCGSVGGSGKLVPSPRYPSSSMSALSSSSSGISVSSYFGILSASSSDASGLGAAGGMGSSAATNAASIVSLSDGPAAPLPPSSSVPPNPTFAGSGSSSVSSSASASSSSTVVSSTALGAQSLPPPPPTPSSSVPPVAAAAAGGDIPPAISPRTDKPAHPPAPPPLRNNGGGTEFCYNMASTSSYGLPNCTSPHATSSSSSSSFRNNSTNPLKNQNCDFTSASAALNRSSCENSPIYPSSPKMYFPAAAATASTAGTSAGSGMTDFNYSSSASAVSPSLSTSYQSSTFNNSSASSTTADSMILNAGTTMGSSSGDFGPIPISPHVNVPNAHNIPPPMPPPLPPRVKRKESSGEGSQSSQVRQAPDAPRLPPRDSSPPPLPPRTHIQSHYLFGNVQQQQQLYSSGCAVSDNWNHVHLHPDESPSSSSSSSTLTRDNLNQHNQQNMSEQRLMLPHTSTIMMRRNSAMDRASKENVPNIAASPSLSGLASTSGVAIGAMGGHVGAVGSGSTTPASTPASGMKVKSVQNSPVSQQQQQPMVCGRRPSTNISPRFSPGETTPKLPPKPKQTNLTSHSDRTMFPYPSTN